LFSAVLSVLKKNNMELVLLAFCVTLSIVAVVGTSFVLGYGAGLFHGYWYWNGAEANGKAADFRQGLRRWLGSVAPHHTIQRRPPDSALPPGPVLFACRPHGILVVSAWLSFLTGRMDRRAHRPTLLAVHSILFSLPGLRELALALGCIDVGRESIERALSAGYSVALLPGGVREMANLPMPKHPGIVRLAFDDQVPLVPVYFGGEDKLCWVWPSAQEPRVLQWLREVCIRRLRLPFPLPFFPRFWDLPRLVTVVGEALCPEDYRTLEHFHVAFVNAESELRPTP
jgi:1-acyl-sn-glycerol-3-phosphate acyltransferase